MRNGVLKILARTLIYYRLPALYQLVVIMLLAAIITGSLLTGSSVRESLRKKNEERLGNSGIVVSSGVRYFPASLADRMRALTGNSWVALTELEGWSRNFNTGNTALNCKILAVGDDFFRFHNPSMDILLDRGEAAINLKLANDLGINIGDEIIVRFGAVSVIPADSPFSPEESSFESLVLVVRAILENVEPADFSLGINQITPRNIFIRSDELSRFFGDRIMANRLLAGHDEALSPEQAREAALEATGPGDLGIYLRRVEATGQQELVSERIFIDQELVNGITGAYPGASPLITYLANSISTGTASTPYSFVSALPEELYENGPSGDTIFINEWLASDLGAEAGDRVMLKFYTNGPLNRLEEDSAFFEVGRIVKMEGIWNDSTLMPEFPGISGMETCSRWDAGVPLNMDLVRPKDEDYWFYHRGTPKAFIGYEKGKEIWGNNFGPATAIRFPADASAEDIGARMKGNIDPFRNGFTIKDARADATEAASNSVDFSTLFMSLGFFIILSSIILLSLIVSTYLESRKGHIDLMRSMGFKKGLIMRILFSETAVIAIAGSLAGIIAGALFNRIVIGALNSVWQGAVQTDTLTASVNFSGLASGFAVTLAVTLSVLFYRSWHYLARSPSERKSQDAVRRGGHNLLYFTALLIVSCGFFTAGSLIRQYATTFFFAGGAILFASSMFLYLHLLSRRASTGDLLSKGRRTHSWLYYSHYPSRALTPVIFIAAGLFIVVSTGANRKSFNQELASKQGGTGGYILWGETATPLVYDMNTPRGRQEYGLEDDAMVGISFLQGRVARGDDASCLNLNQVKAPPLLGLDSRRLAAEERFSFASRIKSPGFEDPWDALETGTGDNCIYGVMDQTVLQWGLKLKPGDTITLASESGAPLHIIIAGGLVSSVFQGYLIISEENFSRWFPSVAGSDVFLASGNLSLAQGYKEFLGDALSQQGADIIFTWDRLAEFDQVSNTYLTVFMTLGGFGMLLGVIGLAFILLRNFRLRNKEFALLLASGYTPRRISRIIFGEHFLILTAGILSGTIPAILATLPSLSSGAEVPVFMIVMMVAAIMATGSFALWISSHSMLKERLVVTLRNE